LRLCTLNLPALSPFPSSGPLWSLSSASIPRSYHPSCPPCATFVCVVATSILFSTPHRHILHHTTHVTVPHFYQRSLRCPILFGTFHYVDLRITYMYKEENCCYAIMRSNGVERKKRQRKPNLPQDLVGGAWCTRGGCSIVRNKWKEQKGAYDSSKCRHTSMLCRWLPSASSISNRHEALVTTVLRHHLSTFARPIGRNLDTARAPRPPVPCRSHPPRTRITVGATCAPLRDHGDVVVCGRL
jgi:hypothetical protein